MKKEWSEEERRAIEAKFRAELDPVTEEREYAKALAGELIPFEDVLRELQERQRRLNESKGL